MLYPTRIYRPRRGMTPSELYGEKIMTIMLSRFHLIPERDGQTDRIAINIARQYADARQKLIRMLRGHEYGFD